MGPIGVLVIRRTLVDGRWRGLVSGLGAASADAVYGFIAAFGLTAVSSLLMDNVNGLRLFGGLFLLYLGLRTLLTPPAQNAADTGTTRGGTLGAYLSTFVLTITNPMTILAFVGIFAGLGADSLGTQNRAAVAVMVGGVFLGSALWWLLLAGGVSLLRERVTERWLLWINRLSGGIIVLFALRILWEVV